MSYSLEFFNFIERPKGKTVALHQHKCYELVFYVTGSGHTTLDGTSYEFNKHNFVINPPETLHKDMHLQNTTLFFLGFHMGSDPIVLKSGLYKGQISATILVILEKMRDEMYDKQPFFELRLNSLLIELVVAIGRVNCSTITNSSDFSYIKNFICENYAQNIDYRALAVTSGYSYDHFRHIFKEKFSFSPHQYVLQLRLKNSRNMLVDTNYTLSRIAVENGFSNESHFCNLFRREYGLSPAVYRNTRRE